MSAAKFVIFTGPSAVGKATIERELFKDPSLALAFSVSATTRPPRPGEVDGVNYYFISETEFSRLVAAGEFIEWSKHFSHRYGTLKREIQRIRDAHLIPFLEVEVNGAAAILEKFGKNEVISIFIAPPSIEQLRERIKSRGSESDAQIDERLSRVQEELSRIYLFDHIVVNDDLSEAVAKIKGILKDEYEVRH